MHSIKTLQLAILTVILSSISAIEAYAQQSDFAEKHRQTDDMVVAPVVFCPSGYCRPEEAYFRQPIPRIIHQIWFGDPALFDEERSGSWMRLAAEHGYDYHLWTEDDDDVVGAMFGTETLEYIHFLRARHRYDGASDILRYHLIEAMGGLYFDIDVPAPKDGNTLLDPAELWPLEGLVLTGENDARELGGSALYAQNHILMAAPHHPVFRALVSSILPNRYRQEQSVKEWVTGAIFVTGQALLSKTLQGTFTMVSHRYLLSLGMDCWPEVVPYAAEMRARYYSRPVRPLHIDSVHIRGQARSVQPAYR